MPDHHHPALHPNIHIHPPTPSLLPAYKRLITALLPIPYPPQFYTASLPPFSDSFALLATWQSDPTPPTSSSSTSTSTSTSHPSSQKQQQQQQQRQSEVVIGGIQARIEDHSSASFPEEGGKGNSNYDGSSSSGRGNSSNSGSDAGTARKKVLYIQTLAVLAPYRGLGVGSKLLEELIEMVIKKEENLAEIYAHVWEVNEEGVEWYVKRGFVVVGGLVETYYRRLRPQGARVVRRRVGVGDWVMVVDNNKGAGKEEGGEG